VVKLVKGAGLKERVGALGDSPLIYVTLASISSSGKCYSRLLSKTSTLAALKWDEEFIVCMEGYGGRIVINVMSHYTLPGDDFIGQAVLDIDDQADPYHKGSATKPLFFDLARVLQDVLPGEICRIEVPLSGTAHFSMFDVEGKAEYTPPPRPNEGVLSLEVSMPSQFTSLCGSFFEITKNLFGVLIPQSIWVIYHRSKLHIYTSRLAGESGYLRTIDCSKIASVKKYTTVASAMTQVKSDGRIQLNFAVESITWAWGDDTNRNRGMWLRCISGVDIDY